LGAWEKYQLGWLKYEVTYAGQKSEHKLGPAETTTKQAQGLFVMLPDKRVAPSVGAPYAGEYFYYSGRGDSLDNFMFKPFDLAPGSSLTALVNYDIELDWDYAYLVVSTDGGATWTSVPTSASTTSNPNGNNLDYGITGWSSWEYPWVTLTADLSAYTGHVLLGFRYRTDAYVSNLGFMVDNVEISGYPTDGAESNTGWTFVGFRVTTGLGVTPYAGEYFYHGGWGDNLDSFMFKPFDLAPGSSLTAQVTYLIEPDFDYAYLVVSTDGGATWTSVPTSASTTSNPNGNNLGYGITGASSGNPFRPTWVKLTADLSAYTGNVLLGFRYRTNEAGNGWGFMVDNVEISGYPADGAESETGWTLAGFFRVTTIAGSLSYFNAYIAEYRQYRGFDDGLRTGPFNRYLPFPETPKRYEHFPYQDGLLISYWDTSQSDNAVSLHPGEGLLLPVDAHPEVMGTAIPDWPESASVQSYDSTFGLEPTDAITLHLFGMPACPLSQCSTTTMSTGDARARG
jgi:bacillopeptidase F (M6 metalloprotease family)